MLLLRYVMLSGETAMINFKVFGVTGQGLKAKDVPHRNEHVIRRGGSKKHHVSL